MINIYNEDCLDRGVKIKDCSVDLGIYDPPFGIGETGFDKHYSRDSNNVIKGYREAPDNYEEWTLLWMTEAKRVLHPDGCMYIVSGNSNLRYILNSAASLGLQEINHIIWKYNFGVNTTRKYVTSHYHILYYSKPKAHVTFNLNCRFGSQEKDVNGRSLLYKDLEDVFTVNKEYSPGILKNQNKLPEELVNKLILYSSNPGDMVCDFFMGNFTTAYCALKIGRYVCGYEINKETYDHNIDKVRKVSFGSDLENLKKVENISPPNQGKKITSEEVEAICEDYSSMRRKNLSKKEAISNLQDKYGRGPFSVRNILDNKKEGKR